MSLSEKQWIFTGNLGRLISWVYAHPGWRLSLGEGVRSDEQAEINAMGASGRLALVTLVEPLFPLLAAKITNNVGSGIRNTLHERKLAQDLNLFVDGMYQAGPAPYKPLGDYWKSLNTLNRWGGDFQTRDANHFSMEDGGVQ